MQKQNTVPCPHSKAFQDKIESIGWSVSDWVPTPGVSDEATEFYITLGNRHIHIMSIAEALTLSDEGFVEHIEQKIGLSMLAMCEQYSVEGDWHEQYGAMEQKVIRE